MKSLLFFLVLSFSLRATPLGDLADTLKPGQWGTLKTHGFPGWSYDGIGDVLVYANTGCWYEDSGMALYAGSDHPGSNTHLLTYADSANSWRCGPLLDSNIFPYKFGTHAYDANALDPMRGVLWYSIKHNDRQAACGTDYACASQTFRRRIISYDIRTGAWGPGLYIPDSITGFSNTMPLKYFPEMDGLVYVGQSSRTVLFYDFKTETWRMLGQGMVLGEEGICQYSSRYKVMLFGGGATNGINRHMYKIDSTGTISEVRSIPDGFPHGIQTTGYAAWTRFVEDPLTGDFIGLGADGTFWCYNIPADYWQKMENGPGFGAIATLVFAIPRYNVLMFVRAHYSYPDTCKVLIYKHGVPHKDTVAALAMHITAPATSTERFLSVPLTVAVDFTDGRTDTIAPFFLYYRSLDTAIAEMEENGVVRGVRAGQVGIEVSFTNRLGSVKDTITLTFTPSTAAIDSIRFNTDTTAVFMSPRSFMLMPDSAYAMTGTVYGHSGAVFFSHPLDSDLTWMSLDTAVATVEYGTVRGKRPGGPAAIVAGQGGKEDTVWFTVHPKPAFLKRINFQAPGLAAPFGWLKQGYYDLYNAARGYGWTGYPSDNNRVNSGTNFLLQTRMISYTGVSFRLDMPPGEYIIKAGMGGITNTGGANWLVLGSDTLMKWTNKAGEAGIQVDTVTVTGNEMTLRFMGYFCYLVVISNEGIDINTVADDGGLADNITGSGTGVRENGGVPRELGLRISPNPFNPASDITLLLPAASHMNLAVYDIGGMLVRTLVSRDLTAGIHHFSWDARDGAGGSVSAGLYVYKLTAGNRVLIAKTVLAK